MVSVLLLRVSVVLALLGMGMGIAMGIGQDFLLATAHAHLNLLGFIALFLSGLYYHVVPEAAASALAKCHAWTAVAGAIVFPVGIATERLGGSTVLVVVGSLIVLVGATLFAAVVFRYSKLRHA